ncbi:MAG: single-stranded-DNA-specific exonuclease C-terminal domain-containing protein, partial [Clostridia bacterium]|nr:single-stranded-DNA-specific exonuclease C-terminal domain-containing protein [Clostridia bacterium]
IFDYAPTDFIARVLKKNPKLQIVICNNDDTENSLQQFFMNLSFEREKAARFYTLLRKICGNPMEEGAVISKFCELGKETELNAKYAISVFSELELLSIDDGKISITKSEDKKELSSSNIIAAMNGLEKKAADEINIIKPKREGKGRK